MFDVGFSELLVIGVVALIVIGPERLPKVARTIGHLVGRLQRYVNDVKADISREVEIDELRKVQQSFQEAARSVEDSVRSVEHSMQQSVSEAEQQLRAAEPATPAAEAAPVPALEDAAAKNAAAPNKTTPAATENKA